MRDERAPSPATRTASTYRRKVPVSVGWRGVAGVLGFWGCSLIAYPPLIVFV